MLKKALVTRDMDSVDPKLSVEALLWQDIASGALSNDECYQEQISHQI